MLNGLEACSIYQGSVSLKGLYSQKLDSVAEAMHAEPSSRPVCRIFIV